jgi:uncharacterized membrane-anchored protein
MDRRTRRLIGRLRPGDVALIDHVDLDRVAAEALVAARVAAVLNARPSMSGRYPTLGPEVLVEAGVPLVDDLGDGIFQHVRDGDVVTVDGDLVRVGELAVAQGVRQDADRVAAGMAGAQDGLAAQLEAFAANTMEFLHAERELLLEGGGVPAVRTKLAGRPCVVVVRGYAYQEDLAALEPYLLDISPVLIGVDGGADALLAAGHRPDLIVGDMDAVSDRALASGAELVVRVSPDGRGFGAARLAQLNLSAVSFPAALAVEDLALLLADARGATTIVTVGTHASLPEFLDRGRSGMASSLLTRLRVGPKLVDAVTVARLHRPTIPARALAATVFSALAAMGGAMWFASAGQSSVDDVAVWWDHAMAALRGLW